MAKNQHNHITVFSQSFALQFISLMLFILIFTVLSFLPNINKNKKSQEQSFFQIETPQKIIYSSPLSAQMFDENTYSLDQAAWEPIRTLLYSHDVFLKISVTTLDQARALFERLLEIDFPSEAIVIEANLAQERKLELLEGDQSWSQ